MNTEKLVKFVESLLTKAYKRNEVKKLQVELLEILNSRYVSDFVLIIKTEIEKITWSKLNKMLNDNKQFILEREFAKKLAYEPRYRKHISFERNFETLMHDMGYHVLDKKFVNNVKKLYQKYELEK